jgi:ribosome biogenesis GTPase
VDDLERLGWDERWARDAPAGAAVARVVAEHRGAYHVAGDGGVAWAELPGKTFHGARDKRDLPTVGDWVALDRWADARAGAGAAVIRAVLPRRSLLVRKAAGQRTMPQPLAANVDVGVVVTSANLELSARRIERYLVVLREAGVAPAIVVNKIDLVADVDAAVAPVRAIAGDAPIVVTSAIAADGAEPVRALLDRRTGVLLGSSGVGKSTLLNRLVERDVQTTQPARDDDDRGRHTTARRELFVLPAGGVVIDTPGMRELGLWSDADGDGDLDAFDDIAEIAAQCRFADCTHAHEPDCAVRAAAERGDLDPVRVAGFAKLLAEQDSTGRRAEQARRRSAKVLARAARDVIRRKYGDE